MGKTLKCANNVERDKEKYQREANFQKLPKLRNHIKKKKKKNLSGIWNHQGILIFLHRKEIFAIIFRLASSYCILQ